MFYKTIVLGVLMLGCPPVYAKKSVDVAQCVHLALEALVRAKAQKDPQEKRQSYGEVINQYAGAFSQKEAVLEAQHYANMGRAYYELGVMSRSNDRSDYSTYCMNGLYYFKTALMKDPTWASADYVAFARCSLEEVRQNISRNEGRGWEEEFTKGFQKVIDLCEAGLQRNLQLMELHLVEAEAYLRMEALTQVSSQQIDYLTKAAQSFETGSAASPGFKEYHRGVQVYLQLAGMDHTPSNIKQEYLLKAAAFGEKGLRVKCGCPEPWTYFFTGLSHFLLANETNEKGSKTLHLKKAAFLYEEGLKIEGASVEMWNSLEDVYREMVALPGTSAEDKMSFLMWSNARRAGQYRPWHRGQKE